MPALRTFSIIGEKNLGVTVLLALPSAEAGTSL